MSSNITIYNHYLTLTINNEMYHGIIDKDYVFIDFALNNYEATEDAFEHVIEFHKTHASETDLYKISIHKNKLRLVFKTIDFKTEKEIKFIENVFSMLEEQDISIIFSVSKFKIGSLKLRKWKLLFLILLNVFVGLIFSDVFLNNRFEMISEHLINKSLLIDNLIMLGILIVVDWLLFWELKIDYQREKQGYLRNALMIGSLGFVYLLSFGYFLVVKAVSLLSSTEISYSLLKFPLAYNIVNTMDYTGMILSDYWLTILFYIIFIILVLIISIVVSISTYKTYTFKNKKIEGN